MTQALSAEIVQEIDQEIITDLIALAGTVDSFDGSAAGPYGTSGNYTPTFIGDRLANLGVIINRVANEIARKTRRGAGNWPPRGARGPSRASLRSACERDSGPVRRFVFAWIAAR